MEKEDLEIKALREEFVQSFSDRRNLLLAYIKELSQSTESHPHWKELCEKIQFIAHKLAGIAESYGFSVISQITTGIDDYLDRKTCRQTDLLLMIALLEEALKKSMSGVDPVELKQDPRFIFFA